MARSRRHDRALCAARPISSARAPSGCPVTPGRSPWPSPGTADSLVAPSLGQGSPSVCPNQCSSDRRSWRRQAGHPSTFIEYNAAQNAHDASKGLADDFDPDRCLPTRAAQRRFPSAVSGGRMRTVSRPQAPNSLPDTGARPPQPGELPLRHYIGRDNSDVSPCRCGESARCNRSNKVPLAGRTRVDARLHSCRAPVTRVGADEGHEDGRATSGRTEFGFELRLHMLWIGFPDEGLA